MITRKQETIKKYTGLCRIIAQTSFSHEALREMSASCQSSLLSLKKFDRLIHTLDTRLNLLAGTILNTLFLFDLQVISRLEHWKRANPELVRYLFDIPAEVDAGISIGTFIFNHPGFPMPTISSHQMDAEEIAHPLIHETKRVPNHFSAGKENRLFIVTGANMAGKSTFLRTLGVNMILAGMGAPVCAKRMSFRPVKILTGMRTTDSLAESESYFFAELKRLKMITERLQAGEKLMVLLDEILKGTNSTDKHKGSVALVEKMAGQENCLAIIATHDLSLAEQANIFPEAVQNYCFESYIEKGELIFDYKLKRGVAKNMNAYFLMKKMGIINF